MTWVEYVLWAMWWSWWLLVAFGLGSLGYMLWAWPT